jgi:hypothetical protein
MEEGDHPELNLTPECDQDGIQMYQSLIGALHWAVTLGRFDILCGVTTMLSFRIAPRQGNVDRLKRIYGYLKRDPDGAIRFRTGVPDHDSRQMPVQYDWINLVYGPNAEDLPDNMPTPLQNPFRTTNYEDANLIHCLVTGRTMSGIIHMVNQTPNPMVLQETECRGKRYLRFIIHGCLSSNGADHGSTVHVTNYGHPY